MVFAYDCGVLRALWLTASAASGFFFLFLCGSRQGVLTESVYTEEIDGTVWTLTTKTTVIVMLYPQYTPLSLFTF